MTHQANTGREVPGSRRMQEPDTASDDSEGDRAVDDDYLISDDLFECDEDHPAAAAATASNSASAEGELAWGKSHAANLDTFQEEGEEDATQDPEGKACGAMGWSAYS